MGNRNSFSRPWTCAIALASSVLFCSAGADAQTAVTPDWDSSVLVGIFLGHPGRVLSSNPSFDDWYHTGTLAITAGRYLTPHLKAEGELAISGEGKRFVQEFVQVPGAAPYPVGSEQMMRANSVSAVLAWQFFENQWVHPFVFGGGAVDFDRTRVHTWAQSYYRGDPRLPGNELRISEDRTVDLGTSRRLRGVVGTGAKFYMTPRAFLRTDARVAVGSEDSGHISFRLGFGVDF